MSRKAEAPLQDPGAMSGLLTGISFIAGVGGGAALADSPFPRPGSEPSEVSRYFTENSRSARLSAAGQLVSSAALARFTASVAKLAERSGEGSRGLRAAAIAGGALAAASLATSGLHTLALSGQWGKDDERAARLAQRSFDFGGPIHGVGFGVLTGALALAGLRTGELPRSDRRACLGGLGAPLAAVLRRRAGGRVHTVGAVLGTCGERDRGGAAWPPLAPGDALPRRGSRRISHDAGRTIRGRRSSTARWSTSSPRCRRTRPGDPRPVLPRRDPRLEG